MLIADDEAGTRLLVRATLQSDRYELLEAADGDEAWELVQAHAPELVLLDVHMPGRTGVELAAAIRADCRLSGTRIVMLTALQSDADQRAALAAGADHYLTKPFSPFQLLELIDRELPAD